MSDHDDELPRLGDRLWVGLYGFGIGALARCLDLVTLLRTPRLYGPYLRVWRAALSSSPFPLRTFEKVHVARRRGLSLRELVYGETPLFTARRLLRATGAGPNAVVVDLLAGRGRVLLAARSLGATARGIELLSSHVEAARDALARAGATLVEGDAAEAVLDDATHVYLTWTCMSEHTRARLRERLRTLREGTVVITLSAALDDEDFALLQRRTELYTWGLEPVYVQVRQGASSSGSRRGARQLSPPTGTARA